MSNFYPLWLPLWDVPDEPRPNEPLEEDIQARLYHQDNEAAIAEVEALESD